MPAWIFQKLAKSGTPYLELIVVLGLHMTLFVGLGAAVGLLSGDKRLGVVIALGLPLGIVGAIAGIFFLIALGQYLP